MRKNKKEIQYLCFSDEGHNFKKSCNRIKLAESIEKFLHEQIGGKLEPINEKRKLHEDKKKSSINNFN
jgi:hypothetical protein